MQHLKSDQGDVPQSQSHRWYQPCLEHEALQPNTPFEQSYDPADIQIPDSCLMDKGVLGMPQPLLLVQTEVGSCQETYAS